MAVLSQYGPVLILGSFVSAAALSALVCLVALALYRRAVGRLMARRAGPANAAPTQPVFSNPSATLTLDQHLEPVRSPMMFCLLRGSSPRVWPGHSSSGREPPEPERSLAERSGGVGGDVVHAVFSARTKLGKSSKIHRFFKVR